MGAKIVFCGNILFFNRLREAVPYLHIHYGELLCCGHNSFFKPVSLHLEQKKKEEKRTSGFLSLRRRVKMEDTTLQDILGDKRS